MTLCPTASAEGGTAPPAQALRAAAGRGVIPRYVGAAVAAALCGAASAAHAQPLQLGLWSGALESVADLTRQDTRTGGGPWVTLDGTYLSAQMLLRNSGIALYDPRLFNLSVGGTFGLSREWQTTDGDRLSRQGTLRGYDVVASVLGAQPTSLELFMNRDQSRLSRELAGRGEVILENRGATLFARRLPLPSTFAFRQEHQEDISQTGHVVTRREDVRNILTYEAQRGWTDRELWLRYEFVDLSALVTPTLSYQSHEGNVTYQMDFGPELNRHSDSRLRYLTRTGNAPLAVLTIEEGLRWDHQERFWTDYRYLLTHTDTMGLATTAHTVTAGAHYRLFDSLTTGVTGDAAFHQLPDGDKQIFRSQAETLYTKQLPAHGALHWNLNGRLEYQQDHFEEGESFIPQETHVIDALVAFPVTLQTPLAITSSVAVTKTTLGPLPVGCATPTGPPIPLVLGRDYTLLPVGETLQVVPIVCSGATPGINPGDTIAVDYRVSVVPSRTFGTTGWSTEVSLDYRWIRPYLSHSQTGQHLLSGLDDGALDDQQSDALGLELRHDGSRWHASLLGEASRFDSRRLSYDRLRSTQFLSYTLLRDLVMTLTLEQAQLDYTQDDHQTWTFVEQMTMTYAPHARLQMEAAFSNQRLSDTVLTDEQITSASLKLRWLLRQLEIHPSVEWFDRRRDDAQTREYRLLVRLIREF